MTCEICDRELEPGDPQRDGICAPCWREHARDLLDEARGEDGDRGLLVEGARWSLGIARAAEGRP